MRTTLNLSEEIISEAMQLSGIKNKTKLIELALFEYMRKLKRERIKSAFRKIKLDIDIESMRTQDRHG